MTSACCSAVFSDSVLWPVGIGTGTELNGTIFLLVRKMLLKQLSVNKVFKEDRDRQVSEDYEHDE